MDPDPDPGGTKTCGSRSGLGSKSAPLLLTQNRFEYLLGPLCPQLVLGLGHESAELGGQSGRLRFQLRHLQAGLEKTRFKKNPAQCFFCCFFGFFFLVFGFFYTFAQKREFLGFLQFQEYF
jgi:hypothetical protein